MQARLYTAQVFWMLRTSLSAYQWPTIERTSVPESIWRVPRFQATEEPLIAIVWGKDNIFLTWGRT